MTVVEWQISHTLPGMILALLEAPAPRKHARVYTESSFELHDRQLEEVLSDLPDTQPPSRTGAGGASWRRRARCASSRRRR